MSIPLNQFFNFNFLQGFCNCLTLVYTFDLCKTVQQRATAGALLSLLGNGGTLVAYILGVFVQWRMLAAILTVICVPYVTGIVMLLPSAFDHLEDVCIG